MKYHEEFSELASQYSKLLASSNLAKIAKIAKITSGTVVAAMYLAAFGGKVIAVTHKGNSLHEEVRPDSRGEFTSIDRFVPLTELPHRLHGKYPNGYSTCLPAIRYTDGSIKYLKEAELFEVTNEILLAALDEGQRDLPDKALWVRVGRYELVDVLSDADVLVDANMIESTEAVSLPKVEFTLLPGWRDGEMVIEKALVQLTSQPPISKANLIKHIRNRIGLLTEMGTELSGELAPHKFGLEYYLAMVEAELEEFTLDSLRKIADDYAKAASSHSLAGIQLLSILFDGMRQD